MGMRKEPLVVDEVKVEEEIRDTQVEAAIVADTAEPIGPIRSGFGVPLTEYDKLIQRQISYAGILQAVLSSQVLAQIPFTTRDEILDNAFFLARESYKHLKEESK